MSALESDSEVSDSEAEANYDPYYDESSEVSDSEAEASPDDMPEAESVVNFFGVAPPVRKEKPKKGEQKSGDKAKKDGQKKKKKSQRRRRAKKQFEEMQRRLKEQEEAKSVQHGDATERPSAKPAAEAPKPAASPLAAATPSKTLTVVYRPCETCGKDGIKKCAACKKAYYCSYTCQSKDWKLRHKQVCKVLAAQ